MNVREFRQNRSAIPFAELVEHGNRWAAFSSDGKRVIASGAQLEGLLNELKQAGIDPQETVLEFINGEDHCVGGAETL